MATTFGKRVNKPKGSGFKYNKLKGGFKAAHSMGHQAMKKKW